MSQMFNILEGYLTEPLMGQGGPRPIQTLEKKIYGIYTHIQILNYSVLYNMLCYNS